MYMLISSVPLIRPANILTVKIVSADFAAASKNSGKNPRCLLKIDITSVTGAKENEHTSRRYTAVFFGDEIYDNIPLLN